MYQIDQLLKPFYVGLLLILLINSLPAKVTAIELRKLCKANGLLELEKKQSIEFTWNLKLPNREVSRHWRWDIQANRVFKDGEEVDRYDRGFINDTYWLYFPLHALENLEHGEVETEITPDVTSPLDGKPCTEMLVRYISDKGYTPGDAYKIYYDDNYRIIEWAFLKDGKEPPARITRWTDYQTFNGIHLATDRTSDGDDFRIWFTNIKVE